MRSLVTKSFWRDYDNLPAHVQRRAKRSYARFTTNPFDAGLGFKRLNTKEPWWSVRLPDGYRAVGQRVDDQTIVWFFIGSHAQYDRLLGNQRG